MFAEKKYCKELSKFSPITLGQMDDVKFMNRVDTKYLLSSKLIPFILEEVAGDYYVLTINDDQDFPYRSLYFDTKENEMYTAHHNRRINRYKIRLREYVLSSTSYLEVKLKNQKKRTVKNRIKIEELQNSLSDESVNFINENTPFNAGNLEPKLFTNFRRITLVNKRLNERITIDYALNFAFGDRSSDMDNVAIIETKCDNSYNNSPIGETINSLGIKPSGMSKYCIGRLFLEKNGLKHNNFKERLLTIKKIINDTFYYRLCS